eukprot:1637316-Amphidinium_carterae.1
MRGVTDNQGNGYIVNKWMSAKQLVASVLMLLVRDLRCREIWLDLEWREREANMTSTCHGPVVRFLDELPKFQGELGQLGGGVL